MDRWKNFFYVCLCSCEIWGCLTRIFGPLVTITLPSNRSSWCYLIQAPELHMSRLCREKYTVTWTRRSGIGITRFLERMFLILLLHSSFFGKLYCIDVLIRRTVWVRRHTHTNSTCGILSLITENVGKIKEENWHLLGSHLLICWVR